MPRKTFVANRMANLSHGTSMRPRLDAAENQVGNGLSYAGGTNFNEAAARCRGKRSRIPHFLPHLVRHFNEAAARCRGKHRL